MINKATAGNLLTGNFFPEQVQVFPVADLSSLSPEKASLLHTHFSKPISEEVWAQLVIEIANWLSNVENNEVYGFYSCIKKGDAVTPEWQLTCCRLNKEKDGSPKEVVMFTYELELLPSSTKARLYKALETEFFLKENLAKAASLTRKEKEIISLLSQGMSSKEIASHIFISVHTVNTHRQHIKEKLGIQHFSEVLKFADVFELTGYKTGNV